MTTRRVVLFGGSFDPVHHGHLIVARAVAELRGFDRITLVPAAQSPHKRDAHASAEHRLAMLRLAVQGDEVFEICDFEVRRSPPSYSIDTVETLRQRHGEDVEMHWVIGADMLIDLPRWHRAGELLDLVKLVIVARAPWQDRLEEILTCPDVAGGVSPAQLDRIRRSVVETPLIDISSTMIRRRIARGASVRYLLPESVGRYIRDHGLYAGGGRD